MITWDNGLFSGIQFNVSAIISLLLKRCLQQFPKGWINLRSFWSLKSIFKRFIQIHRPTSIYTSVIQSHCQTSKGMISYKHLTTHFIDCNPLYQTCLRATLTLLYGKTYFIYTPKEHGKKIQVKWKMLQNNSRTTWVNNAILCLYTHNTPISKCTYLY